MNEPTIVSSESSETASIAAFAAALAKAQGVMGAAKKDSVNPHFKSTYADLASIMEVCRAPLSANALAVMQRVTTDAQGCVRITTQLVHSSGEWVKDTLTLRPGQNTVQGIGSTITYGRRYALAALLGIAAEADDDGNTASAGVPRREPEPAPPRTNGGSTTPPKSRADAAKEKIRLLATPAPDEAVQAQLKLSALMTDFAFTKTRMWEIVTRVTGKTEADRNKLTLVDYEKVSKAVDALIDSAHGEIPPPSDSDAPPH